MLKGLVAGLLTILAILVIPAMLEAQNQPGRFLLSPQECLLRFQWASELLASDIRSEFRRFIAA
jgi:hypothetical protein